MTITAEQLNQKLDALGTSTRVRFDTASQTLIELSPTDTPPFASMGVPEDSAIVLLPEPSSGDLWFVWQTLPPPAAALTIPPELRGDVVIDPSHVGPQPFRSADAPIWELVIRWTAAGHPVGVSERNSGSPDSDPRTGSHPQDGASKNGAAAGAHPVRLDELPIPDSGLPELAPDWPPRNRDWLAGQLRAFRPDTGPASLAPHDPVALHAGLWLIHDFLDESHELSQSIQGRGAERNGDYWHGIMHRREPDGSNAKYWFRRVGDHPVFSHLASIAGQLSAESPWPEADRWSRQLGCPRTWDPYAFVDLCRSVASDPAAEPAVLARKIQWAEILLLLAHCS